MSRFIVRMLCVIFACALFFQGSVYGQDSYGDLVSLFKKWREFQKPEFVNGVPDYTADAMKKQRMELKDYQRMLEAIDCSGWTIPQKVDYHLVRAEMNGLEFDHRVTRPWSRNPCFYNVFYTSPTDVPDREGPNRHGVLRLWEYRFPLDSEKLAEFRIHLEAIPKLLDQAKVNLTEDAKDFYFLGIRIKKRESEVLSNLEKRAGEYHPGLVPVIRQVKTAVDVFCAWLEKKYENMLSIPSGIGKENFNWLMKNVYLLPYTWEDQLTILSRELDRGWVYLKLEEQRNRNLPELTLPGSPEEYRERFSKAVDDFIAFLREKDIMPVKDYYESALREHGGGYSPGGLIDFFSQVEYHDSHPMRCHGTHWFDLARMEREPHQSPIRGDALLYDIWAFRAEGLATGMEEMAMGAGYLDDHPRARELVYILLANRAARAMGDLKMHSKEFTLMDAVDFAEKWTPRGWMPKEGNTVWNDEQLYLNQPGYGTSYVVGKVELEKFIMECAHQLGDRFNMKEFFREFYAAGMIPISLIRWEMTGMDDEIKKLQ